MQISIKISDVLMDVITKSQLETDNIYADIEERYRKTAGEDKQDELLRGVQTASADLYVVMKKFAVYYNDEGTSEIIIRVKPSKHRSETGEHALANLIHTYLVEGTLGLFYKSAGATDLSSVHITAATTTVSGIEEILNFKNRPIRAKYKE